MTTTQTRSRYREPGVPVGAVQALVAAVLFGVASPAAKVLMGGGSPLVMAGLLYLASGAGLGTWTVLRRAATAERAEARLRRADLPWLLGGIVAGGVLAPALQMFGLAHAAASTSSLLLNLETVFTALIAWIVFRESVDTRIATGMVLIVAGGVVLTFPGHFDALSFGALAIVAACLGWAVDNNLTRRIATRDPLQIAAVKGLIAGAINLGLGLAQGAPVPAGSRLAAICALGLASYGISLVLFVLGLRHLGAARTAAYFAVAPFVGAIASLVALGEPLSGTFIAASVLMLAGVGLYLAERHEHEHVHEAVTHDHRHVHDDHHRHAHQPGDPPGEPHAHPHRHEAVSHAHRHYPDAHHRHTHPPK